jgi:hypothetical protein
MQLVIQPGGVVRCVYGEEIDLSALGNPAISRASHVEPDQQGRWWADMGPVEGPLLGPFPNRGEALAAEQAWLETHWLGSKGQHHGSSYAVDRSYAGA